MARADLAPRKADLVVLGRIATLAGDSGFGWVEGIAVADGRVLAAGSREAVEAAAGPATRRLVLGPDLAIVPGLSDAHLHLADAALSAQRIDLEAAPTLEEGLGAIRAAATATRAADDWLEGGGWDPAVWGRWPAANDLDRVVAGRRVALWSHDHHALWVSARLLDEAGIDAASTDPVGGAIRRDERGNPTGVLQETAVQRVVRLIPKPAGGRLETAIAAYARDLVRLGIVAVHDPGDLLADADLRGGMAAVVTLADRGELPIRVHASIREPALEVAIGRGLGTGVPLCPDQRSRARMGWLKLFADGALGSRTALLLNPYEGSHEDLGVGVTTPDRLATLARRAAEGGIVTQIHAIGDAAFRVALDALVPVAPESGPMARIEHVQFADPTDIRRLADDRIAASIQPIHLRSDETKARAAWGARAEERAFLLRSLFAAGAVIGFGSDAPVEPPDPWPAIGIAVTRRAPEWGDRPAFAPREAISLAQALRAATIGPAEIAGEADRGRLTPGQRADFVALPVASLAEPVETGGPLWTARPEFVALDGELVFER